MDNNAVNQTMWTNMVWLIWWYWW